MRFEFGTAQRIVFGPGTLQEVGGFARGFGARALVVAGSNARRTQPLLDLLDEAGIATEVIALGSEPTTGDVEAARRQAAALQGGAEMIVGFGGGSAIDAAKAVAALATNGGELLDYLEIIGQGRPLDRPGLPCIAIPTTAGAGAEATRNAVLLSPAHKLKVSLRSPHILPRVALVDPALTASLPPEITASTGLDALTQLIEPFVSPRANPMTDALCREGIRRVARALETAVTNGSDAAAREDMALASLFGGIALANAGLGAVHGFASPIGGAFRAPHGAVCAALLPHATRINLAALRARGPAAAIEKYSEVARIVTRRSDAKPEDGMHWLDELVCALKIQPLRTYGIAATDAPALITAAAASSSMKGNPVVLDERELEAILRAAL